MKGSESHRPFISLQLLKAETLWPPSDGRSQSSFAGSHGTVGVHLQLLGDLQHMWRVDEPPNGAVVAALTHGNNRVITW